MKNDYTSPQKGKRVTLTIVFPDLLKREVHLPRASVHIDKQVHNKYSASGKSVVTVKKAILAVSYQKSLSDGHFQKEVPVSGHDELFLWSC